MLWFKTSGSKPAENEQVLIHDGGRNRREIGRITWRKNPATAT